MDSSGMSIKKMLVAADGSKPAMYAVQKAIELAKTTGAKLYAIYVIPPEIRYNYSGYSLAAPGLYPGVINELGEIVMEMGKKNLDEVKRKGAEKNVKIKTDVAVGVTSTVKGIVEYAEKNKIDMIIVGSRGLSGFKKMLLGSVASGVVTYAHCAVLVVK